MKLPLILIVVAVVASAIVAYGVDPNLAQYSNGLGVIMISRRLMWPLIFVGWFCASR